MKKNSYKMKRLFDIFLCILFLVILIIPFFFILISVNLTTKGNVLHWSTRVGKNNCLFKMPKIKTMREGTPDVASHLLERPNQYLIPLGSFLRRSSLDEIPQIWSILKGDMSFVGPRPALHNQVDLISLRTKYGIHELLPGITGLAQIYGRDDLPISKKVNQDKIYLNNRSLLLDLKILIITIKVIIIGRGVSH